MRARAPCSPLERNVVAIAGFGERRDDEYGESVRLRSRRHGDGKSAVGARGQDKRVVLLRRPESGIGLLRKKGCGVRAQLVEVGGVNFIDLHVEGMPSLSDGPQGRVGKESVEIEWNSGVVHETNFLGIYARQFSASDRRPQGRDAACRRQAHRGRLGFTEGAARPIRAGAATPRLFAASAA